MELTNSDRLQEIRERAEKATPGPWEYNGGRSIDTPPIHADEANYGIPDEGFEGGYQFYCSADEGAWKYADGEFIAASREDIPWLLQLITEQQREIDRCRRALEAVNEFAKEDDICTHKTIGAQHGWGACFVCLIQATAQGALRGESGFFGDDE